MTDETDEMFNPYWRQGMSVWPFCTRLVLRHLPFLLHLVHSWFDERQENVADKSVIGLAKESAIDDFIPRFHDLAFLHFECVGGGGGGVSFPNLEPILFGPKVLIRQDSSWLLALGGPIGSAQASHCISSWQGCHMLPSSPKDSLNLVLSQR